MATGLALGLSDHMAEERVGAFVLRDMTYGSLLGASTGAIVGGLVVLESDRPKDVLVGTAIGALAGTGIGLVIGVMEASAEERRQDARRREHRRGHHRRRSLTITLNALSTASGELVPAPVVAGVF